MRATVPCLRCGLVVGFIALGCSLDPRSPVARFFFEIEDTDSAPAVIRNDDASDEVPHIGTVGSVHPPYALGACGRCHDAGDRQHVRENLSTTCRCCHERYYRDEVGHPPVLKGQCMKCHAPHRSEEPGLLRRPLFKTCMQCHLDPFLLSPEQHGHDGVERCTDCHDPHFGRGFRIKPDAPLIGKTP